MDSRKQKILQTVVQSYILTGKPVGSKKVEQACGLKVSAATIRGEMANLENLGLLIQPHTSAGRIPTDIAYRYYVDMLMEESTPSGRDVEAVEKLFEVRTREMEGLLQEASLLLSRITNATAMVFAPFTTVDKVKHVELVRLSVRRVMIIVITSSGQVGRHLANLGREVSRDTVERVGKFADDRIRGKGLEEIKESKNEIIGQSRFGDAGISLLVTIIETVCNYLGTIDERVFIGGTANIVKEMEHVGSEWVQSLLEAMEREYFILDLLKELIRENQITVRIGGENKLTELQKCALVGTSYAIRPGLFGSLGVVGPTYIDYARTIGMVEIMAKNLGRRLLDSME